MSCLHSAAIYEDQSLTVMSRVLGNNAENITQASLSSITCKVFTPNGILISSPEVVIASSVFDELQTEDPAWTEDTIGYNFKHTIPASAFPNQGMYQGEYKFTPTTGDPFYIILRIHALNLLQS